VNSTVACLSVAGETCLSSRYHSTDNAIMSQYLCYMIIIRRYVTSEVDSVSLNTLRIGNDCGSAMLDAA
jgi:hypothetical protein